MTGLLGLSQPEWLGMAAGLLNSSGYSTTPVPLTQALGQGLLGLQQARAGMAQQQQAQFRNDLMRQQLELQRQRLGQPSPNALRTQLQEAGYSPGTDEYQKAARQKLGLLGESAEEPKIVEGADGFKYWVGGPFDGQRVLPGVDARPKEEKTIEKEAKIRSEFTKASQEFVDMTHSFTRINQSVQDPSAAGDLALIFNYMKMLDPASVVRESEFATAQNAAGIPERIRALWNNLQRGERMTPVQRKDFFDRAAMLYKGATKNQERLMARYGTLAEQYEMPPERIIYNYALPQDEWATIPPPPPGAVLD